MFYNSARSYKGPIKLVVFDWAGTIIDYGSRAPADAFVKLFARHGVAATIEQARRPMGLGKRDHIKAMAAIREIAQAWKNAHGRPLEESDIDTMYSDFQPIQMACLAEHADLIPGTLHTVTALKRRGIAVGSSTGYFTAAAEFVRQEASHRGLELDYMACVSDVPAGRPEPWMIFRNMEATRVFPPAAVVKVDDTAPGIIEGLNAGSWTIAVTRTGNEIGLSLEELNALKPADLEYKLDTARRKLVVSSPHYVIESVADLIPVIDNIEARLARGEQS